DDPLILQIKEAEASVLEPHLGRSVYDNHARRVVEGQRLMQAAHDLFLGWTHDQTSGVDYYWRNLRDMKVSADVNSLPTNAFLNYAELCGGALARVSAPPRSGFCRRAPAPPGPRMPIHLQHARSPDRQSRCQDDLSPQRPKPE